MMKPHNRHMEAFLSLEWYDIALRFLFAFAAKTSEILLAAGLAVSTANFLTDGNILTAHPTLSTAWAWTQALAIDGSLGVSFLYILLSFKQQAWIKGILYALLTCLLALVAGAITTVDIFSHALHLTMSDATLKMGFSVMVLSRLRAIAVIGFILMGRLRDLDRGTFATEAQASSLPTKERFSASRVQAAIHNLCSQCSAQELVEILNGCLVSQRVMLALVPPSNYPAEPTNQRHQSHHADDVLEPHEVEIVHDGPVPSPNGSDHSPASVQVSATEPLRMSHAAEQSASMEPQGQFVTAPSVRTVAQRQSITGPVTDVQLQHQSATELPHQVSWVPEPAMKASADEELEPAPLQEPSSGAAVEPELAPAFLNERLEQAYQALLAEGKKPSGRALAQRVHVHRSTCMEWLRSRQRQPGESESTQEHPKHEASAVPEALPASAFAGQPGDVAEDKDSTALPEPADMSAGKAPDLAVQVREPVESVFPGVSPDS